MQVRKRPANHTAARSPHHSRHWWLAHYKAWRKTKLTKAEYCSSNSLKYSSFYNWACKFQLSEVAPSTAQVKATPGSPFLQAVMIDERPLPAAHSVTLKNITLQFNAGLSPQDLAAWIKVLQALPC